MARQSRTIGSTMTIDFAQLGAIVRVIDDRRTCTDQQPAVQAIEASLGPCCRAIADCMGEGHVTLECAAARMGQSVRTLQRRLHDVGISFSQLRDRVRLDAACRLLAADELRITVIAARLGFADASSFSRSFQRWTGVAPRDYRRRCRARRCGE